MKTIIRLLDKTLHGLNFCTPVADFAIRIFVASVFWKSGMVKCMNMDSTIWLFANEYQVPILSPSCAAYLSTVVELVFPVLLVLGLFSRFSACILFICNLIAVSSYPGLHDAGVQLHIMWGLMLLVTITHGPGKLSLDHFIWKRMTQA